VKKCFIELMKWSCLLGFFSCAPQARLAPGPEPRAALKRVVDRGNLAVLFVGNSYSFGVPKAFAKLAKDHGKSVRVGHATYGGWTLKRHAANEPTLRKIREGRWDVVVLQEQSEIPAWSSRKRDTAMFPPLRTLVTEVRKTGAVPVLYQTWGRRDGAKGHLGDDFHAMSARLRSGYQAAAQNAGGLLVIPVGDAWEKEFSAGQGPNLYMDDGSHPSTLGNELTAKVFYQAFFGDE
jgi:hypothetical protein